MPEREKSYGFILDKERLRHVVLKVYKAAVERQGIFEGGLGRFLPQFNLPEELEYSPVRKEPRNSLEAGRYLFLMASLERKAQTRQHIKNAKRVWQDSKKRWVFDQDEVAQRSINELHQIMKDDFNYVINDFPRNYFENSTLVYKNYQGNPKKLIGGKTVEEAREALMGLKGWGTGISNLFLIYLVDRNISGLQNPEDVLLKVDIHKSGIPIYTGAIEPTNHQIRRDQIVPVLEKTYWEICKEEGLDPTILDAALWITGSESCAKQDYIHCRNKCVLSEDECISRVSENELTGRFLIYHENGRRNETRRNIGQLFFDFDP